MGAFSFVLSCQGGAWAWEWARALIEVWDCQLLVVVVVFALVWEEELLKGYCWGWRLVRRELCWLWGKVLVGWKGGQGVGMGVGACFERLGDWDCGCAWVECVLKTIASSQIGRALVDGV